MTASRTRPAAGPLLRQWRERRRLSQLELSSRSAVSTRHLSYVETGRSRPSRELLLHLAEELDVPLRERNRLLLSGGYAPLYSELPLDAPEMDAVRTALRRLLTAHEPYPAVVLDRGWHLVDANASASALLQGAAEHLLRPPLNILRLTLHPDGVAGRIVNLAQVRRHLLDRLRRQLEVTADPAVAALLTEVEGYPGGTDEPGPAPGEELVLPIRLRTEDGELAFFSTLATFGTPLDVTVSELMIESFFPDDEATARALRA